VHTWLWVAKRVIVEATGNLRILTSRRHRRHRRRGSTCFVSIIESLPIERAATAQHAERENGPSETRTSRGSDRDGGMGRGRGERGEGNAFRLPAFRPSAFCQSLIPNPNPSHVTFLPFLRLRSEAAAASIGRTWRPQG